MESTLNLREFYEKYVKFHRYIHKYIFQLQIPTL